MEHVPFDVRACEPCVCVCALAHNTCFSVITMHAYVLYNICHARATNGVCMRSADIMIDADQSKSHWRHSVRNSDASYWRCAAARIPMHM